MEDHEENINEVGKSKGGLMSRISSVSALVLLLKILAALVIVMAFNTEWKFCFSYQSNAMQCRKDCDGNGMVWCNNPCMWGKGNVTLCDVNHCYGTSSSLCYSEESCYISYDSTCACGQWFLYSFVIVFINIALYFIEIMCLCWGNYDPVSLQLSKIYESDYSWLFNPWHCWIGIYDMGYLIAACELYSQLFFRNSACLHYSATAFTLFCMTVSLKEIFKINIFLVLDSYKKYQKICMSLSYLLRFDITFLHSIVIVFQALIFTLSCVFFGLPFYFFSKRAPANKYTNFHTDSTIDDESLLGNQLT